MVTVSEAVLVVVVPVDDVVVVVVTVDVNAATISVAFYYNSSAELVEISAALVLAY